MGDLVVARTSGVVMHRGLRLAVRRGQTIARASHSIVVEHPRLWEPITVHYDVPAAAPVETATAAPGEKRDVQLPVSKRPPTSGPGSGVEAWRRHAAEVTGTPLEQWAGKSREDIIAALDGGNDS